MATANRSKVEEKIRAVVDGFEVFILFFFIDLRILYLLID